jgi:tetratricopeptide (TPR) repeat protein
LVLLCMVEGALRVAGYGYPTGFFKPLRIGGQDFLVENDKFGYRFFPPELARLPTPFRMESKKPTGTFRIFLFGESAAMGDPEPAFGAGRYLEVLLRERFPATRFEVVNVAMTAINSHTILPIARDCAGHEGDLWLIYMGNNEMVGPFGAATVFGAQAPPLWFVRASLAIQTTRLGQLFVNLGRKLRKNPAHGPSWGGMQMFAQNSVGPEDPRRERVYRNFQPNLQDILRAGLASGARVLLSTVAVNLEECPPFASATNSNLPPAQRIQSEQLATDAASLAARGNLAAAADAYTQAAGLDPYSAAVQFHWAQCLSRLTNTAAAFEHFQLACDADALPFRADSHINTVILETARRFADSGVAFVDVRALASDEWRVRSEPASTNATSSLGTQPSTLDTPQTSPFFEHVHFTFDGNFRLARIWAEQVARLLTAPLTNRAAAGWASQEICERRLGLTDWNRCNVLAEASRRMRQPPLSTQSNNAERLQSLSAWEQRLRGQMDTNAAVGARQLYAEALQHAPDDYHLHENFADFLSAQADYKAAAAEWARVRELIPQDHVAFFELGRLAAGQGNWAEAESWLSQCLAMRPNFTAAHLELGKVYAAQGKFDLALGEYERALRLQPQDFQIWYQAGLALSKANRRPEAMEYYRRSVQLNADFWEAHFELGGQLGLAGKIAEARQELETALRLNPNFAMTHVNLGVALLKQGDPHGAQHQFEEALRLEPTNRVAPAFLRQAQNAAKPAP